MKNFKYKSKTKKIMTQRCPGQRSALTQRCPGKNTISVQIRNKFTKSFNR